MASKQTVQMANQTIRIIYSPIWMVCPSVRNFYSSIWMADQTIQIIYSSVRTVRQTIQTLQGPFVNRSLTLHHPCVFAIWMVFHYCPSKFLEGLFFPSFPSSFLSMLFLMFASFTSKSCWVKKSGNYKLIYEVGVDTFLKCAKETDFPFISTSFSCN